MKIIVTGVAGFIGSALVRHLIGRTDHEVIVLDELTYAGNLVSLASYRAIRGIISASPISATVRRSLTFLRVSNPTRSCIWQRRVTSTDRSTGPSNSSTQMS